MSRSFFYLAGMVSALALAAACSATGKSNIFGEGGGGSEEDGEGTETTSGPGVGGSTGGEGVGGLDLTTGVGGSTGSGTPCGNDLSIDGDEDGFTGNDGDCNDCDPNVNPGAIEVVITQPLDDGGLAPAADEDCDGQVDNVLTACDDAINIDDFDAMNGAKVVDICQVATPQDKKWGVLSAGYVRANGAAAGPSQQVGVLDSFGPNVHPQNGMRMLGLSSGRARAATQAGACGSLSCYGYGAGSAPPGFPQDSPACQGGPDVNDDIALELKLRAPKNATGYSFNFDFYSFEYPEWVCTTFNDQFIALVSPPPMGSINGNISFDSQSNPVSVNIAFFEVCGGCTLGTAELQGTGFDTWDDAGATSWLKTNAPVTGGEEFMIRFTIWDTGDQAWDSTALVDNFQWIANGGTVTIGTTPVEDPK